MWKKKAICLAALVSTGMLFGGGCSLGGLAAPLGIGGALALFALRGLTN